MVATPELAFPAQEDLGHSQHCRRVALWCEEVAASLRLSAPDRSTLREAAMSHHELGGIRGAATAEVLKCFRGERDSVSARAADLAHILELANTFDEQLEFFPFEDCDLEGLLKQITDQGRDDWAVRYVLSRLQKIDRTDLEKVMPKLPAYPSVAMRVMQLLSDEDVDLKELEQVAKGDQVIAGKLVQIANSAFYSPYRQIRTLSQAIAYVGLEDAKRLLIASGIQQFYSSPRMHAMWKHALEAALTAEKIAKLSRRVDPNEAFLAGLLHDVGKLAITFLSDDLQSTLQRYIEAGCQPAIAEVVLCGFDHCEAGSEIMRYWKFTEEIAQAVQFHHRPERTSSALAGVLYLTEFWLDSNEDLPSGVRLSAATSLAGVTIEALHELNPTPSGALLSL